MAEGDVNQTQRQQKPPAGGSESLDVKSGTATDAKTTTDTLSPLRVNGQVVTEEEWLRAAEASGDYDVDFLRTHPDRRFPFNTSEVKK
jgi:hypothetical protein